MLKGNEKLNYVYPCSDDSVLHPSVLTSTTPFVLEKEYADLDIYRIAADGMQKSIVQDPGPKSHAPFDALISWLMKQPHGQLKIYFMI